MAIGTGDVGSGDTARPIHAPLVQALYQDPTFCNTQETAGRQKKMKTSIFWDTMP
jgi:hypothetical protein